MIFNDENFPSLPPSWTTVRVDEACTLVTIREKIQTKNYLNRGSLAVVDQGSALVGGYSNDASKIVQTTLPVVVFGDHTRALKFVDFPFAAGADGIKVLRPSASLHPRLVFRFLEAIKLPDRGYGRHFQHFRGSRIPLPPLDEQGRIADKLDAVLARVDACRDRLDRVPAILKRFRQSVLAAAMSGELTAEWRGADDLLGWTTLPLAEVCECITDGDHQAPPQAESGVPFITISAMNDGRLRLDKASRFVSRTYFDALKSSRRPERGDVLFSVTGSIGISALVDSDGPFTFQRHIAILKPKHSRVLSSYLAMVLRTDGVRQQALAVATGTAQLTIPITQLRSLFIDVSPLNEQAEIVRRVESLFAWADRLEARHAAARAQVERLTPSLLAKAFRGELVPQDPTDEPASELLERLTQQPSANPTVPMKGKGPKPHHAKASQIASNVREESPS